MLLPFLLAAGGGGAVGGAADAASTSGVIFQPWQLFWFLGDHGHVVHGLYGEKVGFRAAPGWVGHVSHPLVLAAGPRPRRRRRGGPAPPPARRGPTRCCCWPRCCCVRCLLDTWNTSYYALPFLLALLTWEARSGRAWPALTAAATLACWVSFETLPRTAAPDVQAAFYLAWAVPLAVALAWRSLAGRWPPVPAPRLSRRRAAPSAAR